MSYQKPISFSSLKLYQKCPARWANQYVEGNRYPSGPAAVRGTEIHAALEDFFSGGPYRDDVVLERWRTYMRGLQGQVELQLAVNADWQPVEFDSPDAYFRGVIDLCFENDVYDWKTGKMYDDHVVQAEAYAALLPVEGHVTTHFVYLDQYPTVVTRTHSAEERMMYVERLREGIEVLRMDSEYNPTPHPRECRYCPLSWRNGGACRAAP